MLLHTVSASPFSSHRFNDAVTAATNGDGVLLLGDAIYAAINTSNTAAVIESKSAVTWYVIDEDCKVRGIAADAIHPSIKSINYDAFVELVIAADSTIAW